MNFKEYLEANEEPQLPKAKDDKSSGLEPSLLNQQWKNSINRIVWTTPIGDKDLQVNFRNITPAAGIASAFLVDDQQDYRAVDVQSANFMSQALWQLFRDRPSLAFVMVIHGKLVAGLAEAMESVGFSFIGYPRQWNYGGSEPDYDIKSEFWRVKATISDPIFRFRKRGLKALKSLY